jgi:DNA-binding PadR family transcriptional regulator
VPGQFPYNKPPHRYCLLWILLALREGEKSMGDIKIFIKKRAVDTIDADDKSMYRALRRFDEADLITFTLSPNPAGPDIKLWTLTPIGKWVLTNFVERNIKNIFLSPQNKSLFE